MIRMRAAAAECGVRSAECGVTEGEMTQGTAAPVGGLESGSAEFPLGCLGGAARRLPRGISALPAGVAVASACRINFVLWSGAVAAGGRRWARRARAVMGP